jgi:hypothetical protein
MTNYPPPNPEALREAVALAVEQAMAAAYAVTGVIEDTPDRKAAWDAAKVKYTDRILALTVPAPNRARRPGLIAVGELLAVMRDAEWAVAVHNDYWLAGERHTFWLFTHRRYGWVKGEGKTDAEALGKAQTDAGVAAMIYHRNADRPAAITEDASELIQACAAQFREYERQHRAKGTPEADAKAEVNAAFAKRCEEALAGRTQPALSCDPLHYSVIDGSPAGRTYTQRIEIVWDALIRAGMIAERPLTWAEREALTGAKP